MTACFVPTTSTIQVWERSDLERRGVRLNAGRVVVQREAIWSLASRIRFHPAAECRACQVLLIRYGLVLRAEDIRHEVESA